MLHIYMIVRVLNYLSDEDYLSKFAELIEMAVSWLLKTVLACIVGLNVIQGLISPAIDTVKRSVITRSAEAIPGIGDAIGGMAEVAIGTAVLVKKWNRYGRGSHIHRSVCGSLGTGSLYRSSLQTGRRNHTACLRQEDCWMHRDCRGRVQNAAWRNFYHRISVPSDNRGSGGRHRKCMRCKDVFLFV